MKDVVTFFHQHSWLIISIVAIACVLLGRIWSDKINLGEITEPLQIMRKNRHYKVVNTYTPETWTEDWIVGSIICLKSLNRQQTANHGRDIYISGDRVRFTDDGPVIGSLYQVITTKKASGTIVMKPVK